MHKDKTRLVFLSILTILVLATAGLYGYSAIAKQGAQFGNLLALAVPLLVVFFMAFFITRRHKDIKEGMPFEDERSKKVITLAAAKSFYIALYWLLAIGWFEEFFAKQLFGGQSLTASQAVGGGIAGMAVAFFACWFYYNKKAS